MPGKSSDFPGNVTYHAMSNKIFPLSGNRRYCPVLSASMGETDTGIRNIACGGALPQRSILLLNGSRRPSSMMTLNARIAGSISWSKL